MRDQPSMSGGEVSRAVSRGEPSGNDAPSEWYNVSTFSPPNANETANIDAYPTDSDLPSDWNTISTFSPFSLGQTPDENNMIGKDREDFSAKSMASSGGSHHTMESGVPEPKKRPRYSISSGIEKLGDLFERKRESFDGGSRWRKRSPTRKTYRDRATQTTSELTEDMTPAPKPKQYKKSRFIEHFDDDFDPENHEANVAKFSARTAESLETIRELTTTESESASRRFFGGFGKKGPWWK